MFEKEAEEYTKKNFCGCCPLTWKNQCKNFVNCGYHDSWKDGAEFGYNKANEWHYVKNKDYPKDEDWKWCVSRGGYLYVAKYEEMFGRWTNREYSEVMEPYAWKEIVLPELKESE